MSTTHTRKRTISGAPRTTAHSPTVCGTDDVASSDEPSAAAACACALAAAAADDDDDDELGIDDDEIDVDVECALCLAVVAAPCLSP